MNTKVWQRAFSAILVVVLAIGPALAGDASSKNVPKSDFRAEYLAQLADVEKKIVDLAGAVPQEKYGWRPGEGVRSISEVYAHIVGANYFFMTFVGVKMPAGMDPAMEKTMTDKGKIAEMLKQSFNHVRQTVTDMLDASLEKETDMFGRKTTYRDALLTEMNHLHEHMGQSIAYARTNGVVPPWTAAEQASQKDSK
jgi:uncharacterized damage-inducible protein DinB